MPKLSPAAAIAEELIKELKIYEQKGQKFTPHEKHCLRLLLPVLDIILQDRQPPQR